MGYLQQAEKHKPAVVAEAVRSGDTGYGGVQAENKEMEPRLCTGDLKVTNPPAAS